MNERWNILRIIIGTWREAFTQICRSPIPTAGPAAGSDDNTNVKDGGAAVENVTAAPSNESSPNLYSAPFLTTWLCSAATVLYLPLYVVGKVAAGGPKKSGLGLALRNGVQSFRERGFTPCEYCTLPGWAVAFVPQV